MQHRFGLHHRLQSITVTEKDVALIAAVVSRQEINFAGGCGPEKRAVAEEKVCPAYRGLRIRIPKCRSNHCPPTAMSRDQAFRPVGIREAVIFGQCNDRRGRASNSQGIASTDRLDWARLDDSVTPEIRHL